LAVLTEPYLVGALNWTVLTEREGRGGEGREGAREGGSEREGRKEGEIYITIGIIIMIHSRVVK